MRSVTEPLKRVANRRKSIKSKTGFMLESKQIFIYFLIINSYS